MGLFSFSKSEKIPWVILNHPSQLEDFDEASNEKAVLLFKHSTRCSISSMAKHRLESDWDLSDEQIIPVYLDLLAYRSISNLIAERYDVQHESPQVIMLKNGQSIYTASHNAIRVDAIKEQL